MRLIEAIVFYGFALTVGGVWLSLGIEGWRERRKPRDQSTGKPKAGCE